ncbi:hypothetical protein [Streptomyces sp. SID3343]|uniref:hypothetical protein n=1 Tax=Streptomyces sp. SID3343 TaxID=2690260 RepID=UPI00136AA5EA|nr:hypothetical protein [Streptomyces sp. SID3343]MYW00202.1 hypothetical protein [Streptomyces sp. SID3343]
MASTEPERPREETDRRYAWYHLSAVDEYERDGDDHPLWRIADVAGRLDELTAAAYLGQTRQASETDLLAALLVVKQLQADLVDAEGYLLEATRRKKGCR